MVDAKKSWIGVSMSVTSDFSQSVQLDPKTVGALGHFARRRRLLLALRGVAAGIVFLVLTMILVAAADYLWLLSDGVRWMLSLLGYAVTLAAVWHLGLRHVGTYDPRQVARQLESADPRLREDLLSAVELADPKDANGSESFRRQLQSSVGSRSSKLDVGRLLPVGLVQRWLLASVVIACCCVVLMLVPRMQFGRRFARAMLPMLPIERASLTELTILKPDPASGYVAEGDAVGVTVEVGGRPATEVWMQWKTDDGVEGETVMTARVSPGASQSNGTLSHHNTFAANLSVGTAPVFYRVLAGDAITLWHELTPLPRPRVESFQTRYVFPEYAQLPDRVEEAEHGDLKALAGTKAEVVIRFDEPVDEAMLSFGNRGVSFELDPVEGTDRDYVVSVPIRTPANYQVDATSRRSGLNNPFSPQYSITPIIDSPPTVDWGAGVAPTVIVSPLEVVPLFAKVTDDLPIETVLQEFSINGQPIVKRIINVEQPAREIDLQWEWDLLHRITSDEASIQLQGGDIIQTRLVAIDRKNQRVESAPIEILIAEQGFDSDRHANLDQLRALTAGITTWSEKAQSLMDQMREASEKRDPQALASGEETALQLINEQDPLLQQLMFAVRNATALVETSELELLGRALIDTGNKVDVWFKEARWAMNEDAEDWKTTREKALRELSSRARRITQDASRIEQYAKAIFGEALTVGIVGDAMSLQQSLAPLNDGNSVSMDRMPRHVAVVLGRLEAIDLLVQRHEEELPDSTQRHLENWSRWLDSWVSRLQVALEEAPKEDAYRALVRQFSSDLRNQHRSGMYDSRLSSTLTNMLREIRIQIASSGDGVRQMLTHGGNVDKTSKRLQGSEDSKETATLNRDLKQDEHRFGLARAALLNRLEQEETLHRERQSVDLQYAADLSLMHRAIENVSQDGFQPYREEPAAQVFQKLGYAFQTVEAYHELKMWLGEVRDLMLAERELAPGPITKFEHATQIERIGTGLEWPVRTLQNAGINWQDLLAKIDQARYGNDFNQARNWITSRRWSDDEMISADAPLSALEQQIRGGIEALQPSVEEARATILEYVLSLPEQARQAAEKVKEAEERIEDRSDSDRETTEQIREKQQEADDATRETLEALVDLANTAAITDEAQRELARDADAAAAQIQDAADRAEEAMEKAELAGSDEARSDALNETEQALEELAQALDQTAEHFQRAEDGEDLAETREQLRQAEAALEMQADLDQRYDDAEQMADAAESTPQELLEQLEQELQQNPPMQQELSEIAERAAEAAQQRLEQAAKEERQLNRDLEQSDPNVNEKKRRAAKDLANLARRASSIDQSLLDKTERSVGWANIPQARPKLDEAREQLRDAVQKANEMGGEQALLEEMQQTANEMADALKQAGEALSGVKQESDAAVDEDIHKDEASRNRTKAQLEGFAREARAQQLRDTSSEKQQWAGAKRDADRRASQARNQKRSAENRKRPMQDRMKREPKNEAALKQQIAAIDRQIQNAEDAEQAARETQTFAGEREKAAQQREQTTKNQKIPSLDKPNPAAELASQMTSRAQDELQQIQDSLRELSQQVDIEDQLRAPKSQADSLANRQERIEQQVGDATAELRRAARHEERLGQNELAQQLDATADAIDQTAAKAASDATQALQQAAETAETTPEANQRVAQASQTIEQVAEQLAELLRSSTPPENAETVAGQSAESSQSQQQAEQMAKTLDELDRALAQSDPSSSQQGDELQSGQSQPSQPGQEPNQQAGQQSSQPQNAAEASPTLADAMQSQAQQAARQRQEQMNPTQPQSSSNPASEPGSGQAMPDGGRLDIGNVDRVGNDWGQLRERRTDDAAQSRSSKVAPQYRREIEAYFRAIAKRAAEKSE